MKMCFDKRVLIGLGVVAAGVLVFAPTYFWTNLPILALLACPLSMLFMMRRMGGQKGGQCSTTSARGEQAGQEGGAELLRLQDEINTLKGQLHNRRQASDGQSGVDRT